MTDKLLDVSMNRVKVSLKKARQNKRGRGIESFDFEKPRL